jgi:hypothetical protein
MPHAIPPSAIEALEQLSVPAVICDSAGLPLSMTAAAAALFKLERRSNAEQNAFLISLADATSFVAPAALRARQVLAGVGLFHEQEIAAADGLAIKILLQAFPIHLHQSQAQDSNAESARFDGWVVILYDLSPLEPVFRTIETSRSNRAFVVMSAAYLSSLPGFAHLNSEIPHLFSTAAKAGGSGSDDKALTLRQDESVSEQQADLLANLRTSVDIVDQLIAPSVKISVQVQSSFLIELSRPVLIRALCHLLLEGSDFSGAFGQIKVGPAQVDDPQKRVMKLLCTASRSDQESTLHPLVAALYRRSRPSSHRVRRNDDLDGDALAADAVETSSPNIRLIKEIVGAWNAVTIRKPSKSVLELELRLPLVQGRVIS